jgi:flagellar hook-length control protein FliK
VSPQSRPTEQAGVGGLGKAQREPARDAGEALPADASAEPGGEASSGAMPVTRGVSAEATPSPAPPQPAEQAGTGVQAPAPRTAAPAADLSGEQRESGQRRPEERLVQGVKHATAPSGHDRTTTAGSSSSGGSALQTGAPSPAAGGTGPAGVQDAAVAPTAAAQLPGAGAANAPQLTATAQLGEMIDAIHATIELAARHGATQARIALQPEELGEIRIHLSQSADGIVARLTAATPAAAQALAAGRGELHQSLSSLGATLLQLDIGTFEGREGRRHVLAGEGSSAHRAAGATEEDDSIAAAEGATPAAVPGRGPRGALVDVLA